MRADIRRVRLGKVCDVERGGSPRPIDSYITDSEEGVNWIKIGDADHSMYITRTAQKIRPEGVKKSRVVHAGDFLLSNSMSFGRPYILKIDGCIHDGWLVLHDRDNVFYKPFLYYYLSAPTTYSRFKAMAVGGVVNNLNSKMVRDLEVPLLPLDEQKRIAAKLDLLCEIISKREEQLAKLKQLAKSRFVEVTTPLLEAGQTVELDSLVDEGRPITYGILKPGQSVEGGIPVVKVKDFPAGEIDESNLLLTSPSIEAQYKRSRLRAGDLLISIRGSVGRMAQVPSSLEGANITQDTARLTIRKEYNPVYVRCALETPALQHEMERNMRGVAIKGINIGFLRKLKIPVPSRKVQDEVAAFRVLLDKSEFAIRKRLEKARLLYRAKLQEFFG